MEEFFGSCTNHGECQEACPKEISIDFIAMMNRDYLKAKFKNRTLPQPHALIRSSQFHLPNTRMGRVGPSPSGHDSSK